MKKVRLNKKISLLLAVLMLFVISAVSVSAMTKDEAEKQKSQAQRKKKEIQYQVDQTQTTADGIRSEIEKAEMVIRDINQKIAELDNTIADLEDQLAKAQAELEKTRKEHEKLEKKYGERMKANYMMLNGEVIIDMLFSSTGVGDLISKVDSIVSIAKADQDSLAELEVSEQKIIEKQNEIESQKAEEESAKQEQESLLSEQDGIKSQLETLYAANSATIEKLKADIAAQDAEIKAANRELAAIAAAEQKSNPVVQPAADTSSGFIWPSDCGYLTSYFGYGGYGDDSWSLGWFHEGIDIGAGYGTPIYATASGRVIVAQWYGAYGNCVEIAHSNGYTSLYGHMSSIAVSNGQYVYQGQVIGYCGSTGNSTGPHIHFTIFDPWGNYVDPLNFVSY